APPDFLQYLQEYWLPLKYLVMWAAVYRKGRTVYELSDTNMLIEAWHHVFKGKFLEGRRSRRMDHLVYVLVEQVVEYYGTKGRRQINGFEGPNLYFQKRL
ncbi:hypothetical protein BDZ97DRAFT_1645896, partial [Flammula alnicola]